jgi:hypothetical protein
MQVGHKAAGAIGLQRINTNLRSNREIEHGDWEKI